MGISLAASIVFTPSGVAFMMSLRVRDIPATDQVGIFLQGLLGMILLLYLQAVLLLVAIGQYIVHLYMAVSIRKDNKEYLAGDSEDQWGFGQVIAMVLLIPVVREIGKAYIGGLDPPWVSDMTNN